MIGALLAAIVLGGVSLVGWGCVGWFRLIQEGAERERRALPVALAVATTGVVGVLLLQLTVRPVLELSATLLSTRHSSLVAVSWLPLCCVAVTYVAARLFRIRSVATGSVLFGAPYALLAAVFAQEAFAPAFPRPWPTHLLLAVIGIATGAAALGVALARRAQVRPSVDDPDPPRRGSLSPRDVAVLIPAHDEAQCLPSCLAAISAMVPRENIFVASDDSTDDTVKIARGWGCSVSDIWPNVGKAKALQRLIDEFSICTRFEVVLIADADAEPAPDYLDHALPLFDDPEVVAVAGHAIPRWCRHWVPRWSMFFAAYRTRLYRVLQALLRYGQTWRHSNVSYIVPGFSSMYRTRVLPRLDLTAPGLAVEDFNMTFAIHRHGLGRIAYTPRARSVSQEAYWLRDYWKQVTRWYLGFWQTVRHHGIWASRFWISLGVLIAEMLVQSLILVSLPILIVWFALHGGDPLGLDAPLLGDVRITAFDLAVGVFAADYAMTVVVAVCDRKPTLLFYGVGFIVLRWIDSLLFLITLPRAFLGTSDGRWVSPRRI